MVGEGQRVVTRRMGQASSALQRPERAPGDQEVLAVLPPGLAQRTAGGVGTSVQIE